MTDTNPEQGPVDREEQVYDPLIACGSACEECHYVCIDIDGFDTIEEFGILDD